MERQVILCPSPFNFLPPADIIPQRLRLRDDGSHNVDDASRPPSADPLAFKETSGRIACYLNQAANHFILWDTNAAQGHKRVFYDPVDNLQYMAVCFGHSAQGETKIVLLEHIAHNYRIKVHTVAGEAGADSGGSVGPDGHFVGDATWSQWLQPMANTDFWPDLVQPARFLVGNATMYFYGLLGGQPMIVTFNVDTNVLGTQNLPPHEDIPNARFGLGFGLGGELSAALYQQAEPGDHTLTVWGLRNGFWEHVVHMMLDEAPAVYIAYPYIPLCFFHGRTDVGRIYYTFLYNGQVAIRVMTPVPVNTPAVVERLHAMARPVLTSLLPPAHYVSEPNRRIGDGWRAAGQCTTRNYTNWQRNFMEQCDEADADLLRLKLRLRT